MNKEEILEKSKNDYKKHDPLEETTMQKIYNYGSIAMLVTTGILLTIHLFILKMADFGLWAIVVACTAANLLARGVYQKKKAYIIAGVLFFILAVIMIAADIAMITSME